MSLFGSDTDYIHQDGVNAARETTVSFSKSTINFDFSVTLRHELRHQFPTCPTGRHYVSSPADCQHTSDLTFSLTQHMKNCISFRTDAERTDRIDANADIDFSGDCFHRGSDASGLNKF